MSWPGGGKRAPDQYLHWLTGGVDALKRETGRGLPRANGGLLESQPGAGYAYLTTMVGINPTSTERPAGCRPATFTRACRAWAWRSDRIIITASRRSRCWSASASMVSSETLSMEEKLA